MLRLFERGYFERAAVKAVGHVFASFLLLSLLPSGTAQLAHKKQGAALQKAVFGTAYGLTSPAQPTPPAPCLSFPLFMEGAQWHQPPGLELIKLGSFRKMKSLKIQVLSGCKLYHAVICLGTCAGI